MPRKSPKLVEVRARVAEARRIVDVQSGLVERLRAMAEPTLEAQDALNHQRPEAYELKRRSVVIEGRHASTLAQKVTHYEARSLWLLAREVR